VSSETDRGPPYGRHEKTPPGGERPAEPYSGEKARQGNIVLNTPLRRTIFIGGLAAIVLLVLVLSLL
jgi:hypothetical protein